MVDCPVCGENLRLGITRHMRNRHDIRIPLMVFNYRYVLGLGEPPTCKNCGGSVKFVYSSGGGRFRTYCTNACARRKMWSDGVYDETILDKRNGGLFTSERCNDPCSGIGWKNHWRNPAFVEKMFRLGYARGAFNGNYLLVESPKGGTFVVRSSYEKRACDVLDSWNLVKRFTYEPFEILFSKQNTLHGYFPDFIIDMTDGSKFLLEIKALDGFKLGTESRRDNITKCKEAFNYCRHKKLRYKVWTEDHLWGHKMKVNIDGLVFKNGKFSRPEEERKRGLNHPPKWWNKELEKMKLEKDFSDLDWSLLRAPVATRFGDHAA